MAFFRAEVVNRMRPVPTKNNATTSLVLMISAERLNITPNNKSVIPETKRQI
jgi:hypothetical protein